MKAAAISDWGLLGGIVGFLCISVAITVGISALRCRDQWKDSDKNYEYRVPGGCMVQLPDKTWIPASVFRVL